MDAGSGTQVDGGVGFARWRSSQPSGGNRYDTELTAALRTSGLDVRVHPVSGRWPLPEPRDRERFASLLAAERSWLVGNIVASAAPQHIRAAVDAGRRVTVLVHYFPGDDLALPADDRQRLADSEAAALRAASRVVTTSAWAAAQVTARYGRDDVLVAVPGTEPAPIAPGSTAPSSTAPASTAPGSTAPASTAPGSTLSGPPTLLWLGRLSRSKDPATFVAALAELRGLAWTAQLVGPDVDGLRPELEESIAQAGLVGRVHLPGTVTGGALAALWAGTDLLVHTSRAETYGLVVAEALARGIPSVVTTGTGAVEAQAVGASVAPGDHAALAAVLRAWLTDADLRHRWRVDAARERAHLPTWQACAAVVRSALAS